MMTRKNYEAAAKILRTEYTYGTAEFIGAFNGFKQLFQADNPRFDVEVFRAKARPDTHKEFMAGMARWGKAENEVLGALQMETTR